MKMKHLFYLLLILYPSSLLFGQKNEYSIHISQTLQMKKAKDADMGEAIKTLEKYINEPSDSLFFNNEHVSRDLKNIYSQIVYPSIKDTSYSHFYIIDGDKISDNLYNLKIVSRVTIPQFEDDDINTIMNIWVRNNKIDIGYKERFAEYKEIKQDYISYLCDKDYAFNKEIALEAIVFCDSIKSLFKIKELPQLTYILSAKGASTFKVFGADYFFNPFGCFIKNENILFSNGHGENYKHELVHYVLQSYNLNNQISEGIAVYLGGSSDKDFMQFIINNIKEYGMPTHEQIVDVYTAEKQNMNTFKYLYSLSSIAVAIVDSEKGTTGLNQLLDKKHEKQNFIEVLQDILNKSQDQVIDIILEKLKSFKYD